MIVTVDQIGERDVFDLAIHDFERQGDCGMDGLAKQLLVQSLKARTDTPVDGFGDVVVDMLTKGEPLGADDLLHDSEVLESDNGP